MSSDSKDIALSIIHFLRQSVKRNEISEDYAESMDVAIDCIADAFEVNKDDDSKVVASKFGGKGLEELLKTSAGPSVSGSAPKEQDDGVKEKADELKTQGNREMASKNFEGAIAKYTEAIELYPGNAVYYSNRAAAYSSVGNHALAVKDANKAIEIDPSFSKAYSRLGLAHYANGDAKAALQAYEKGMEAEGPNKSEAMKKGYETAKRRVEQDLESSISSSDVTSKDAEFSKEGAGETGSSDRGAGPDLSSMFGGGAGGVPNFADLMNNPQLMLMARNFLSDPSALQNLMSNPAVRQMAEGLGGGSNGESPNLSELMNNPMLKNLANQFMGGNNNGNNNNAS